MRIFKPFLVLILNIAVLEAAVGFERQIPQKFLESNMKKMASVQSHFSEQAIKSKKYVKIKSAEWSACHQRSQTTRIFSNSNENVFEFLESNSPVLTLDKMDQLKLSEGRVEVQPWSGDYWAYAMGLLGARIFEDEFMEQLEWIERYKYILSNSALEVVSRSGQAAVNQLSPSEKYDLIVGDQKFSLTNSMWAQGKRYYDANGSVEAWMGICHGWAPAAIVEPRPSHSIDLQSMDQGLQIHLVPAEIKGIVSYTWANNHYETNFLGQRCNIEDPQRDENGRLVDSECIDLNPASWHLAVVNMIGQAKRSFVMDASYDYEVWNQPVFAYSYNYVNVLTSKVEKELANAIVPIELYSSDPYKKYRAQDVVSIVGISMKLAYVIETSTNKKETDSIADDRIRWVQYEYDLELNSNGEIIGGEWHQLVHPDFIWSPKLGERPTSPLDPSLNITDWQGDSIIPESWARAARRSSKSGITLDSISQILLLKSNRP